MSAFRSFLRLVAVVVAILAGAGTTVVGEGAFAYDSGPDGLGAAEAAEVPVVWLSQSAEALRERALDADDASTTPALFFVAPGSLPRSGPIPQSLGAASRAEQLAKKLHLNVNSPTTRQILNSLDDNVADFVGTYRKGSIWRELPGEVADMSVEEALRHSSTVRKLLIDNRFVK